MKHLLKFRIGDIFDQTDADAIVVTTNGVVKPNGELVMGGGIAKAFAERYPGLANRLGYLVKKHGNRAFMLLDDNSFIVKPEGDHFTIISCPTKESFQNSSIPSLIRTSCKQMKEFADAAGLKRIIIPPLGCGLGGLDFKSVVEPILDEELDSRFQIIVPNQQSYNVLLKGPKK